MKDEAPQHVGQLAGVLYTARAPSDEERPSSRLTYSMGPGTAYIDDYSEMSSGQAIDGGVAGLTADGDADDGD